MQSNPVPGGGSSNAAAAEPSPGEPGFTTQLFASSRTNLLGDMYGLRSTLGNYGITLGLQETSEVFGNATGGQHRGVTYDGLLQMSVGLDTEKAFGWEGGTFNISAFQIHGRNLATDNLLSLQTNSGIEAQRATRLWELWYQQVLLDGKLDVKIGQQSLDQEFIGSQYSGLFINTMMGWPLIPSGRPVCRRPGISAVLAGRAGARAAVQQRDRPGRCVRRQPAGRLVLR